METYCLIPNNDIVYTNYSSAVTEYVGGVNNTIFEYSATPGKYIVSMYAQAQTTGAARYDFYLFIGNNPSNTAQFTLSMNHSYPSASSTGIVELTSTSAIKMVFWGTANLTLNTRAMTVLKLGSK